MFPVFLGNDQIDPFIVNTAAELNTVLNTLGFKSVNINDEDVVETIQSYDETVRQYFILVPEDFRHSFETDIIHAIQDIAGKPVAPLGRLFSSKKHYNEAVRKYNESEDNDYPFTKEQVIISTGAQTTLQDFLKKDWKPKHPERKRYLHIDQSLSGDSTGVACCYLDEVKYKDGETLMCPRIEWMIRVNPPKPPAKISIARIRSIIPYLSEKFEIEWGMISYDTYQCLTGDNEVLTEDGIKYIKDVKKGDKVYTRYGFRKVLNTFKYEHVPTIKVTLKDGRFFEGTPNHRMSVTNDNYLKYAEYDWKELRDFKIGDKLQTNVIKYDMPIKEWKGYVPRNYGRYKDVDIKMTEELAYILGFYIGNGRKGYDGIELMTGDANIMKHLENCVEKVFGVCPESYYEDENHCYFLEIYNTAFIQSMEINGFEQTTASYKRIPDIIKSNSLNIIHAFISGYIDTDGSVDENGTIGFNSTSLYLLRDLQNILNMRCGIKSSMIKVHDGGKTIIKGVECNARPYYALGIFGNSEVDNSVFKMSYKISQVEKTRKGREIFNKVTKIEESVNDVYDIQVENGEYVVNGLVSHNSAESIQHLEEDGYNCKQRSVDRTDEAYLTLVDLYYEGRLSHPQIDWYEKELFQLIHFRDKRKVDHPPVDQRRYKGYCRCCSRLYNEFT